MKQVLVHIF